MDVAKVLLTGRRRQRIAALKRLSACGEVGWVTIRPYFDRFCGLEMGLPT